ncbi:ribose-phosphate pyrophosphokinase [bacterium]|nr:ribose-phosphate pyrophosphokinase [bacterium]
MTSHEKPAVICNASSQHLTDKVCSILGIEPVQRIIKCQNDGESYTRLMESLIGKDVFIIASTNQPEQNIRQAKDLLRAAYEATATNGSITLLIPYHGYGRQDRPVKDREVVSLVEHVREICNTIPASQLQVVLFDLHADAATEACYRTHHVRCQHIFTSGVMVEQVIENVDVKNLVAFSPDMGGVKRTKKYAEMLGVGFGMCYKVRSKPGVVDEMYVLGNVDGKDVIIIDDMIDTGGSIVKCADYLIAKGARKIYVCATHAVLSNNAIAVLQDSRIEKVFITDTISHPELSRFSKFCVVSVADLISEVILKLHSHDSIAQYRFRENN